MYMLKLVFITMINNYKHVHITFDLGKSRGFVDLLGTLWLSTPLIGPGMSLYIPTIL
jgi:hypothetical protein